jgi:2-dehydro-3-deoxyglucarate aldolase/4-hydroxy-2-oxoheptanedioate aldolase
MRKNALRQALQGGKPVFGTMLQESRSSAVPELMAAAGCDFIFIDMEHGAFNMETVADLIKVTRLTGMTPLVRVPDDQYHLVARVLDAGAQGIMVPRVEHREQVEKVVQWARFPPDGCRGCSVLKGHSDYQPQRLQEFTQHVNRENMVIVQIERRRAVEHIDDLLSVAGIDGAIVGPNDLALSLGIDNDLSHPLMIESLEKVVRACERHGVPSGMHVGNLEALTHWMAKGMRFIVYSTDLNFLLKGAQAGLKVLRDAVPT